MFEKEQARADDEERSAWQAKEDAAMRHNMRRQLLQQEFEAAPEAHWNSNWNAPAIPGGGAGNICSEAAEIRGMVKRVPLEIIYIQYIFISVFTL